MKFEKLTDTKIKITLSLKDMELNNISLENILSNSADSQKLIESIIYKAEQKLDFNTDNSQLLVEAMSPSHDEFIFIITRILHDNLNSFIFKFKNFDDFISLCCFLKNLSYLDLKNFSRNFSLIFYSNTYYLRFNNSLNSSILINYLRTIFSEFGIDVSSSVGIDGVLNEYGKIIWKKNAIIKCINCFSQ